MTPSGRARRLLSVPLFAGALALLGCGGEPPAVVAPPPTLAERLGAEEAEILVPDDPAGEALAVLADGLALPPAGPDDAATLTVDYPLEGSVFPPDMVGPRFLWHDDARAADAWLVDVAFADGGRLRLFVPGPNPPAGEIDPEALGPTNAIYEPTPYQRSARSWAPTPDVWSRILERSREAWATVTLTGFARGAPQTALSRGQVRLKASADPVGAPIFYRDVPLMPSVGKKGRIQPLARGAIPLIRWRLRDLARPTARVVLREMPTCANCHSFSLDGSTMGMDVDGPEGDKGSYLISPVEEQMTVESDEIISWNDFEEKPAGHKTIGFLSRVSPDGRYALTTLNETLYVANFQDYRFLQVFYPTGGILAWYDTKTKEMKALPGADDPAYVHANGVWTPDGEWIVYSRAKAFDPVATGAELAAYPNDPKEPKIQYDLYRIPFNKGAGGEAVPIEGASQNGMSNTFPKVSPNGKWIVYTKCRNGQLMRPDGRLWIVPAQGGEAREMECNTSLMNSWHSFSPNSRWLVFSSKVNTPYTQMFLTHVDDEGRSTPPILVPDSTAANRAVNIPEFLNAPYDALQEIQIPAVNHHNHTRRGYDLLEARKPREALAQFEQARIFDPGAHRIHAGLGFAYAQLGQREEARRWLESALAEYEEAPLVHLALGTLEIQEGRVERAVPHLERAVDLSPRLLAARKTLGAVLIQQGRPAEAVVHLRRALMEDVRDVVVHRQLVAVYRELGNWGEAIAHMKDVLQVETGDFRTRTLLAWTLATCPDASLRNGEEARRLAEASCEEVQWGRPEPMDALAAAYAELGRFGEAVKTVDRALESAAKVNPDLVPELEARLALYRANRPYRTP